MYFSKNQWFEFNKQLDNELLSCKEAVFYWLKVNRAINRKSMSLLLSLVFTIYILAMLFNTDTKDHRSIRNDKTVKKSIIKGVISTIFQIVC